ncbi:MAG: M42 family peptidase [Oscillospiraceae bacterium]|nr:M42 family peptidase [Oscillospiraceae bacterium]
MDLIELTKQLCSLPGPSGFEEAVFDWTAEYLRPIADEIHTDSLGNLLAIKRCGQPDAKLVMLDAHLDEIGFIVTGAQDGFLTFDMLGGVDHRMLPAREVRVLSDPSLFGVIDTMPPHLLEADEAGKTIPADKLFIDVGLTQEEALKAAPPGTPIVYASGCDELCAGQLCGKALDDRACAAIIIKAFETLANKPLNVDLGCQLSTQEEVGRRGAAVGAWNAAPDIALVVDVTHAKTPDGKEALTEGRKGAAIGVGPNLNRAVTRDLFRIAEEHGITHQTEPLPGDSGTNAAAIQISRQGVATGLVSLPLKYMHTPVETVWTEDMTAIEELLIAYVEEVEV